MKLSIIVVTYNSRQEIEQFLLSLSVTVKPLGLEIETLITDNASGDGTPHYLLNAIDIFRNLRLTLILNRKNLGLSKALNLAIAQSVGDIVMVCNPDIVFNDSLSNLFSRLSQFPGCGVVPLLVNSDGSAQHSPYRRFPTIIRLLFEYTSIGELLSKNLLPQIRRDFRYEGRDFSNVALVEQVAPVCLLINRAVVKRFSPFFDERFPVFWNDVDLSMRARELGVKFLLIPEARIPHFSGHSIRKVNRERLSMLFLSSAGMMGFLRKWRMHPRFLQMAFFMDCVWLVGVRMWLSIIRKGGKSQVAISGDAVEVARFMIMKLRCSLQ